MTTAELYTKGARLWIPDNENVWKGAEAVSDIKDNKLVVESEDGEQLTLQIKSPDDLPPLRNPDILIGENDLTSLSYLNEPEVLYNLQIRFSNHNAIYTYCGIVLVAINPYEELPIYGNDTITAYRGQGMGDLDPHIFAVAEEAFTEMEREEQNQSIIVSGESGAGKTVSAKYAMRYFAAVGGSATETQVEKKVLASNPIMEAIGNAKTTRNDNSSRFGKYIEIDFNKQYNIIGANVRTYLLEKSRVVFQANEERNYHIFYQLCASADSDELKELRLGDQDEFNYTNQGQSAVIAGVDDGDAFTETRNAFTLLGFSDKDQMMIFRILAAILHLGNVTFMEGGKDGNDPDSCTVPVDDPHLPIMASLLGIDEEQMRTWLCYRKIVSMREVFTKPIPMNQASFSRDALSKHIYAQLFDWIVTQINKSLASTAKVHKFIGVLDIYGFETFEINSFEQFCINYANEKLQQQFNQHVFKLEQEEYVREKIEWKFIDFYDNQPAIDLIETKMGVLDLLDEECKMPKGSDETWVQKLYDKCSKSKHFAKPRLSNTAFIVCHFADNVQYESRGFLEKNRDTVMEEQINILKASQHDLVAELFMEESDKKPKAKVAKVKAAAPAVKGGAKQHKKTVGSQFRDSLTLLMKTLNSTTPHYVRCIKPNDEKTSFNFNPIRAVQQLRACGVLETIRISAAGFPSRWTYQEFFSRYRVLIRSKNIKRNDMKVTSENILQNVIKDEDKYRFGKTKIFFRAGQVAYLEKLRSDKLKACCIMIQKNVKGWLHRKRYLRIRKSLLLLQTYSRGLLARRQANFLRRTKAAKHIQRHVRGFVQRQKYTRIQRTVLVLQSHARGKWARQRFDQMRRNRKAIILQRWVRGFLARQHFKKAMTAIVYLQSCVRRMYARRELKALKIEARSVEHIKSLNKGLENKIISLQQKIGDMMKENKVLKTSATDAQNLRNELENLKGKDASLKVSSNKITELQQELEVLRTELERERDEKMDLVSEKEQLQKAKEELEKRYNDETSDLKEKLDKATEQIISNEKGAEEFLKQKVNNESKLLLDEFTEERTAHQKLLKEYARMEQRYENLQNEVLRMKGTHHRTPSNISTISLQSDATETVRDDQSDFQSMMSDNPEDDIGYASVRSRDSVHSKLDNIDWDQASASPKDDSPEGEMSIRVPKIEDVSLVLKLQQKLKEAEEQKARLAKKLEILEGKDDESPPDENKRAQEMIRLQELEMENAKQKDDLRKLRKAIAEGSNIADKELMDQFEALQDEQERRREECIQLRSVLANSMEDTKTLRFYGGEPDLINEDGELYMAFETQKKLIRQLEAELQAEKKKCNAIEEDLRHELKKLLADNERQQKLISQNLQKTPEAQTGAYMQHEITRLTGENLDLREKIDGLTEQIKKLKKQLKIYAKKLKDAGGAASKRQSMVLTPYALDQSIDVNNIKEELNEDMPVVKHKETEYLGMFEYRKEDEATIIKSLIIDLKPRLSVQLLPGLPAYILFMCVRHTDYINDDEKVRTLLTNTINGIKRVIRKRHEDLEVTTMWLANTCRMLHNLKQYSGDKSFQVENTPKQNEQCLRNFDLSEYRQVLSDIAVWIYQAVIKIMEEKVQPLIVPSVLEHEAIPGISGKPSGMRGRSSSVARELESPVDPQRALDTLMKELSGFHRTMNLHGVDPELITQVFKQILYFVCAGALNNLLLRKDMCHWSKGMQIRYNLSHLEQWCRDQKLQDAGVTDTLQPVIQASQLLQARKTDEDVQSICEMCDKLTISQIIKILNLYTPADEFEERVPISFIRKIQAKLAERVENPLQSTLLMDTKFAFPVRFPFNPSNIRLEDINIPDNLNLQVLKKV